MGYGRFDMGRRSFAGEGGGEVLACAAVPVAMLADKSEATVRISARRVSREAGSLGNPIVMPSPA